MKNTKNKSVIGKSFPMRRRNRKAYRSNSLTIEEQDRLFNVLDSLEDMALFRLALSTGIRREDIVRIEVGRIDWNNRRLSFWEAKKRRDWVVPLHSDTLQVLKMWTGTRPKKRKLFDFSGRTAYNKLQRALKKAEIIKEVSFHDLRRSFVKTAKKKGLSPKAVAQITGDTLAVIQEHYENMDDDELRDEIDKL